MGKPIILTLPVRTVSESNRREHWAAKARRVKNQRTIIAYYGKLIRDCLDMPKVIHLTRIAPRRLDTDNLAISFKAVRDEIAKQLGLPDDRDGCVTWLYNQRKGGKREYAIEVSNQ